MITGISEAIAAISNREAAIFNTVFIPAQFNAEISETQQQQNDLILRLIVLPEYYGLLFITFHRPAILYSRKPFSALFNNTDCLFP